MSKDKKEKTEGQLLEEKLFWNPKHVADLKPDIKEEAFEFCEAYKYFLNNGKTERECVNFAIYKLKNAKYQKFDPEKKYKPGDKVYQVNRGKAIIAATIGTESVDKGIRMSIAHVDSPRLDLKPNPMYEDTDLSFFKTHYYGGIRKYQWATIPLAIHGVICRSDGEMIHINIGERKEDPVFCVTDLLPHLSSEQDKRTLREGIKGEELNLLIGSLPFDDEEIKERVKLQTLKILHEEYGITEKDFICGELEIVPAHKARDVGFDRSMLGAYGQDDRVCAYPALMAEIGVKNPKYTTMCVLTDKEEIGSTGNTGLESDYTMHFMQYLAEMQGVNDKTMLRNSKCLSADVNAAFDPTFPTPFDKRNSSIMNKGCTLAKYTGSGGKYDTSDADATFIGEITRMMDKHKIAWQSGELGAVDQGGGGTVAMFVARHNIDVVDLGVPVLSMHSPFEIVSKMDVYHTFLAFKAFVDLENK